MSASALASGAFSRPASRCVRVARRRASRGVGLGGWDGPSRARRSWTVTCSSAEDRFAHVRPGDPDGRNRADISVGAEVDIVLKADQGTGRLTRGIVREFLTNSKHHPQGIKVRLVDGAIGRVERVVAGGGDGGSRAAETASEATSGDTNRTNETNGTKRARDASSSSSSSSPRDPNGDDATCVQSTVYLSNIPKALSKADVRWLVEEIPGVTGLRLPKRGGKNMGYSFITCDSEASANAVIAAVHGMELEGKALVAERARTETRSAGDAADKDQKKTEKEKGKKHKRGKQWKRDAQEEEEEEEDTFRRRRGPRRGRCQIWEQKTTGGGNLSLVSTRRRRRRRREHRLLLFLHREEGTTPTVVRKRENIINGSSSRGRKSRGTWRRFAC